MQVSWSSAKDVFGSSKFSGELCCTKACRVAEQQSQDLGKWRVCADKSNVGAIK